MRQAVPASASAARRHGLGHRIIHGTFLSGLSIWFIVGCASGPVPTQKIVDAGAAIRAAREVGAQDLPAAALHLKLAQDQLEAANKLVKDGENIRAALVLARSEVDAELAVALAREARQRGDAAKAAEKLKSIR
jgi:hypothetical protein